MMKMKNQLTRAGKTLATAVMMAATSEHEEDSPKVDITG
jgi:hypothetical protein